MKCVECGGAMKTRRENYQYAASGLPGITLRGVEVRRCPRCGATEVAIPRIEDLHRAIAQALIGKPSRLAPEEVRYLRKYLGWSGADYAAHMGTTPETVSRWETGAAPMGGTADRLLRLMVVTKTPVNDYSLDLLRQIHDRSPKRTRLTLTVDRNGWQAKAA